MKLKSEFLVDIIVNQMFSQIKKTLCDQFNHVNKHLCSFCKTRDVVERILFHNKYFMINFMVNRENSTSAR